MRTMTLLELADADMAVLDLLTAGRLTFSLESLEAGLGPTTLKLFEVGVALKSRCGLRLKNGSSW